MLVYDLYYPLLYRLEIQFPSEWSAPAIFQHGRCTEISNTNTRLHIFGKLKEDIARMQIAVLNCTGVTIINSHTNL